ncbi:lipopolysaccharide biosynthesis protein [Halomonas sp. KM-1]|uniref:lipopolysaccharide biosynthesis protein n=1 Tax=Halomonas sp. KM-1 TaxID=590061 RepID=UPI00028948B7|nr:lipopolysaccharide biosynthesis protein [Halomonas sp. KM-1]
MSIGLISQAKRVVGSKFFRNVAVVASGTAGAQVITMAFTPIITRLYGPEAFGVLGTFTAILAVLAPLAALSYPIAIVLPKRDADAIGLAKLSLGIASVMSLLAALILTLFKSPIVDIFNLHTVEPFMLLLPFAMLFSATMAIMSQWVIRKKLFKIKAKVAVLQSLWLNTAKAGIGLFSPLAAVLVVLATVGSALHALLLWAGVRKSADGQLGECSGPVTDGCKALAWRHRDFAYYRTPQIVLNAASQSLPVLMLASFFGPAAAGFYALGRMVLGVPSALIGESLAAVFYPRVNEAIYNGENAFRLLVKATIALAIIGVLPFGLVVVLGPNLFTLAFGSEWSMAGEYAQWLALWSYFGFINRPSVSAIPVLALQGLFLLYEVASVAFRIMALFVGFIVYDSALVGVALFSVIGIVLNFSLIAATCAAAHKRNVSVHDYSLRP